LIRFLVVFDVDSTLIEDEAIELLADKAGQRDLVAQITDRAMRGEIDFTESLVERVATLKDLPESVLEQTAQILRPTKGATELIEAIHERSGAAAAVSGGFIQLLKPLQEKLKLDYVQANTLETMGGKLTGRVLGSVIDAKAKADFLKKLAKELNLELSSTIAVGDGANDVEMVRTAGIGIAFCAKPKLREVADVKIDIRDLAEIIPLLP
jgi:phosphoserine phosphatase